ncbi:MAG: hypothetical protein QGD93_01920 [Actinomycetota bacterium]|nr:hypothetical protein [Actinomycetota bacterium]
MISRTLTATQVFLITPPQSTHADVGDRIGSLENRITATSMTS